MATGKKYYWIKLRDTFLTSEKVDYLLSQKDGANYVVIYQMLCLKTINSNGVLGTMIGEVLIPYDEEKIQRDLKHFNIDTIRIAFTLYKNLGMVYVQDNGLLKITEFNGMVGSETDYANQKRKQRIGVDNGVDNVHIEIRDKRLEIRDIDIREKSKRFIPPTLEEIQAYINDKKLNVNANKFYQYFNEGNWVDSKGNKVKNWKQKLLTWDNKNKVSYEVDTSVPIYDTKNNKEISEEELNALLSLRNNETKQ